MTRVRKPTARRGRTAGSDRHTGVERSREARRDESRVTRSRSTATGRKPTRKRKPAKARRKQTARASRTRTTRPRSSPAAMAARSAPAPFVQLPPSSDSGYYHYSAGSRQFGTPPTVQALVDIAAIWQQAPRTSQAPFGVGDISFAAGGPMPPHTTGHRLGRNVDIRPMRKDLKHAPVTWRDGAYSRELTQLLVNNLLAHANTMFILFNDPDVQGVRPLVGHDNHLHVQLKA
jgi:penicillin-insensitive murein endopeptidase